MAELTAEQRQRMFPRLEAAQLERLAALGTHRRVEQLFDLPR